MSGNSRSAIQDFEVKWLDKVDDLGDSSLVIVCSEELTSSSSSLSLDRIQHQLQLTDVLSIIFTCFQLTIISIIFRSVLFFRSYRIRLMQAFIIIIIIINSFKKRLYVGPQI